jgi:2-keto-4-pentenoate hydratase/2-oxohepta-3-ene-1,7-dioic acid hydratase in catechol pathway
MRLARFTHDGREGVAEVAADRLTVLSGGLIDPGPATGETFDLSEVRLLPPVVPSKVFGVGWNYVGHADELGHLQPSDPLVFLKAPSAIVGPDQPIVRPEFSTRMSYEGELVAVIGKECTNLREEEALDVVLGWTCGNDVTDRDIQEREVQFARSKSFNTFCPLGPWVETNLDLATARIETRINGELVQSGSTDLMIHTVPKLLVWVSRAITLLPGDVIMTGTPKGVGLLEPGDVVEVTIPGIGTLRNPVIAETEAEAVVAQTEAEAQRW